MPAVLTKLSKELTTTHRVHLSRSIVGAVATVYFYKVVFPVIYKRFKKQPSSASEGDPSNGSTGSSNVNGSLQDSENPEKGLVNVGGSKKLAANKKYLVGPEFFRQFRYILRYDILLLVHLERTTSCKNKSIFIDCQ